MMYDGRIDDGFFGGEQMYDGNDGYGRRLLWSVELLVGTDRLTLSSACIPQAHFFV